MTDKKTEALRLALDALEEIHLGNMTPMAEGNWNKAITAIREALASGANEQPSKPLTDEQWQRIADITDSIITRGMKDEIESLLGIMK